MAFKITKLGRQIEMYIEIDIIDMIEIDIIGRLRGPAGTSAR